jgi:mannose-6-phosphate isomerase-like protein (cupin superfamily)
MADQQDDPRGDRSTVLSERPWGDIHMLVRNQRCSVDLTHVRPGERASYHSHAVRSELFHFIDDGAYLELDGQTHRPGAHEEWLVRPGMKHRFWAEDHDVRILVISFGEWTAEDQVRHRDDYGREGHEVRI